MPVALGVGWTDDRVATLKQLWADGLSATQIADRLGDITRNAVIGKVHRLGLARRRGAQWHAGGKRKAKSSRLPSVRRVPPPSRQIPTKKMTAAIELERVEPPLPLGRSIIELGDCQCRWPDGDPAYGSGGFCGQRTRPSWFSGEATRPWPYCDHHARIAYRPARRRR
jgi:GcrA cell cycle regulator